MRVANRKERLKMSQFKYKNHFERLVRLVMKINNFLNPGQMVFLFFSLPGLMLEKFFRIHLLFFKFFRGVSRFKKLFLSWTELEMLKFSFYYMPGANEIIFLRPANSSEFVKLSIAGSYDKFSIFLKSREEIRLKRNF